MKLVARVLLGLLLVTAGIAHLVDTDEFLGQVPTFFPARTAIVVLSGFVEIGLGVGLLALRGERLRLLGLLVGAFFVLIFPGNLWQAVNGSDSFGLDTTPSRVARLFFQPVLVAWAWWCTGAWARVVLWWRFTWRSRGGSGR